MSSLVGLKVVLQRNAAGCAGGALVHRGDIPSVFKEMLPELIAATGLMETATSLTDAGNVAQT